MLSIDMFSELEAKIAEARNMGSPIVRTLLGYLSRAKRAHDRGDEGRAYYLVNRAMEEK